MTARVRFVVRYFSLDPDRAELCLERAADVSCQLGYSKNFGGLLEEIRCELHSDCKLTTEIAEGAEFISALWPLRTLWYTDRS